MVTPLALWLSPTRRRGWCGDPSALPTHLDHVLGELPSLRAAIEAPAAHIRKGHFHSGGNASSWRIQSAHPYVRVIVFPAPVSWCAPELRRRMPPLHPVAIPVPPGRNRLFGDTGLPPRLEAVTFMSSSSERVYRWSTQPVERVSDWLDALGETLARQREILADLADWTTEAAQLEPWKADHSRRIARAVPAQRRIMELLGKVSDDYYPVLSDVLSAVGGRTDPDPAVEPETILLNWARGRNWLIVKDPDGDRMVVCREAAFPPGLLSKQHGYPMSRTLRGITHRLTSMTDLSPRHLAAQSKGADEENATEVVWDESSIELCDREIARLWADLDAEHDLPRNFASVWKAFFGYDHRSVFARNREGTREVPEAVDYTAPKRRGRYGSGDGNAGGGGGGDFGFYGGIAAGGDSGGGDGGSGGGGGCGGGGGGCGGG